MTPVPQYYPQYSLYGHFHRQGRLQGGFNVQNGRPFYPYRGQVSHLQFRANHIYRRCQGGNSAFPSTPLSVSRVAKQTYCEDSHALRLLNGSWNKKTYALQDSIFVHRFCSPPYFHGVSTVPVKGLRRMSYILQLFQNLSTQPHYTEMAKKAILRARELLKTTFSKAEDKRFYSVGLKVIFEGYFHDQDLLDRKASETRIPCQTSKEHRVALIPNGFAVIWNRNPENIAQNCPKQLIVHHVALTPDFRLDAAIEWCRYDFLQSHSANEVTFVVQDVFSIRNFLKKAKTISTAEQTVTYSDGRKIMNCVMKFGKCAYKFKDFFQNLCVIEQTSLHNSLSSFHQSK
ncbi:MAG: hypothetical protein AAGI90_07035 [Chlamydiota bacterium]